MENGKTLLLVEDDAIIALAEGKELERLGYAVSIAPNGLKAIETVRARSGKIDLILMDIDLGSGMDGTEAAMTILHEYDIPVLFLTSHTEKEILDKTEKITSYGFVVKNTGVTMLDASIRMAFRLHNANRRILENNKEIETANEKLQAAIEELSQSKEELQQKSDEYEKKYVQLAMAQSAGRIGSYDLDLVTGEGPWSDTYCEIMGVPYRETPWTFDEWKSFILPEDLPHVIADFKNALAEGENISSAYRVKRRDNGEIRWLEARGKVMYGDGNKPVRMVGIVMDVTDRRLNEEALQKSEETYRFLFNNVPVGIGISDTQGLSIDCNKVFEEILGRPISEMQGRDVGFAYRDQSDRERIRSILKKEGKIRDQEVYFKRGDGSEFCALINIDTMSLHGKTVNLVTMRDISDRKRAEELLRESEMRYRTLVENSLLGIGMAHDDRILYANKALLAMYGYDDLDEFSSRPFLEYLVPESREVVLNWRRRKTAGETVSPEFELDIVRKDGERRTLRLVSSYVTERNETLVYTSFADITDHKKAEEALKKTVQEKEILMREIQHRVKNNLVLVSSLLSISMGRIGDEASRRALQESIDRIGAISSIYERLYQSYSFEKISLGRHIEDIARSLMSTYASDGKVGLTMSIDNIDVGLRQAVPLGLILNELITNAVKHAHQPGEKGNITVGLGSEGGRVTLTVSDNGRGLPPGFSMNNPGGLGLHLVDLLTSQINGKFSIRNGSPGVVAQVEFEHSEK